MIRARIDSKNRQMHLLVSSEDELVNLKRFFTKKIRNHQFKTKKNAHWKGDVHYFQNNSIPLGLWMELVKFGEKYKYQIEFDDFNSMMWSDIDKNHIKAFCYKILEKTKWTPRDYQIDAVFLALKYRYCLLDLAPRAGKTLIQYLAFMYLKYNGRLGKILIICPDADLVIQNATEYIDYSNGQFKLKTILVHGNSKDRDIEHGDIIIGNYQTLINMDASFFQQITNIFVDEGHRGDAESYRKIIKLSVNTQSVVGMSGSITEDGTADHWNLMAMMGPIIARITKKQLMDAGQAASINIIIFILNYLPKEERKKLYDKKMMIKSGMADFDEFELYRFEQQLVRESQVRLKWLIEVLDKLPHNTLVFFVDKKYGYGKSIVDNMRKFSKTQKEIFYIDGDVHQNDRLYMRKQMEEGNNKVLVASYDTMSTGKTIKNLRYIVLAESRKSEVIIGQGTSRGMTLHPESGKESFTVIDVVDDFSLYEKDAMGNMIDYKNSTMNHSKERIRQYKGDGFNYKISNLNLLNTTSDLF